MSNSDTQTFINHYLCKIIFPVPLGRNREKKVLVKRRDSDMSSELLEEDNGFSRRLSLCLPGKSVTNMCVGIEECYQFVLSERFS